MREEKAGKGLYKGELVWIKSKTPSKIGHGYKCMSVDDSLDSIQHRTQLHGESQGDIAEAHPFVYTAIVSAYSQ